MIGSVHEVARYANVHVRYTVIISGNLQYITSLVPEVLYIATFTIVPYPNFDIKMKLFEKH